MALERVTVDDLKHLVGGFYCQNCSRVLVEKQGGICLQCAKILMDGGTIVKENPEPPEPRTSEKLLETVIAKLIAREVDLRNELDLTASAREFLEELVDAKKRVDTRRVGE